MRISFVSFPVYTSQFVGESFVTTFFSNTRVRRSFVFCATKNVNDRAVSLFEVRHGCDFSRTGHTSKGRVFQVFANVLMFPCGVNGRARVTFGWGVLNFRVTLNMSLGMFFLFHQYRKVEGYFRSDASKYVWCDL